LSSGCYRWDGEDLILCLKIQPKASHDQIAGLQGEQLKIRITAPPVDGKANSHLIRFLAKSFGVSRGDVIIETGQSSRNKVVRIHKPSTIPSIFGPN
jgi:uncharacterized protein (TIGR00251 family)